MKRHITRLTARYSLIFALTFQLFGGLNAQDFEQDLSPYQEALTINRNGGCGFFDAFPEPVSPTCNGFLDGMACVSEPTGGVGPYTFIWVGSPDVDRCRENVGAGTYTVIVFDQGQGGAQCSFDVIVNEPAEIAVFAMNAVSPSCFGVCDGEANPIVIGGNGGFMFNYDSGEMTQAATMLCDPFQLTITDGLGCETDTFFVFANGPDSIEVASIVTDQQCFNVDDGAIDITITGASGVPTVVWSGPDGYSSIDEDISGLSPGTYDIIVTDGDGCTGDASIEVLPATEIAAVETITDIICAGTNTGSIELEVSEGAGGYTFSWTGPTGFTSMDEDIFDLFTGAYQVTITDSNLCEKIFDFEVAESDPITVSAIITDLACAGVPTGAIDVTIGGPFAVISTEWVGPDFTSSSEDISGLTDGQYTLTITDDQGCVKDTIFNVLAPDPLELTATVNSLLCNGDMDGSIDLEVTGGDMNYDYVWTGTGFNSTDQDISGLLAGDYTVVVTDGQLCEIDSTFTIIEPDPIMVDTTITHVDCFDNATGSIEIDIMGGTGGFSSIWTGPDGFSSSDEDIFNLVAGVYTGLITDDNGCTLELILEVLEPEELLLSAVPTDLLCNDDDTGTIDLTITGGVLDYVISWTGEDGFTSEDEDLTGLSAGTYTVLVVDDNGCDATIDVTVDEPEELVLTEIHTDISCFGENDGTIDLTITGGTGVPSVLWTSLGGFNSIDEDLSDLPPDIYTVFVTDENNCEATLDVEIIEPLEILIDATLTHVLCFGEFTGSIELDVSNGVPDYTFSWSGPSGYTGSDEDIFMLEAGTYTVLITDENGCTASAMYELTEPEELVLSAVATNLLCNGDGTGAIDLTITGGTPDYTISWSEDGGFTSMDEDLDMLDAGIYTVLVTDDNGCTATIDVPVDEPEELVLSETHEDISCFGADDGSIDLTITGGTGNTSVSWTSLGGFTSSDEDLNDLSPDIYTVLVTDENGCPATLDVEIIEPLEITIDATVTDILCFGAFTGSIILDINNGVPDYDFQWSGPNGFMSTDQDIFMLEAGLYTVIVTDDNGCTAMDTYEIMAPLELIITAVATPLLCNGDGTGSIDLSISGGTPDYSISWSGDGGFMSSNEDLSNLGAGLYTVIVTDDNGCPATLDVTVDEPLELEVTGIAVDPDCAGDSNGTIDITVVGGTENYSYSWDGPIGFIGTMEDLSGLEGGSYTVTVTDANDCVVQASFSLTQPEEILVNLDITDSNCGMDDGTVTANVTGGTVALDYTYNWFDSDNISVGNTSTVTDLAAGSYLLIVTDDNGCTNTQALSLSDAFGSVTGQVTNVTCLGDMNGAIDITILDLTLPLNTAWSGPDGYTSIDEDISMLSAGEYIVTITDDVGCTLIQSFTVDAPEEITLTATIIHEGCDAEENGSIDLSAQGGEGELTYTWTGPGSFTANTQDIINLSPGDYTVTVTDENLCTAQQTYTVNSAIDYMLTANITDLMCNGDSNGAIDLIVTPVAMGATYQWTGPGTFTATSQDLAGLSAGTYTVSMTTAQLCSFSASFDVQEPTVLNVQETLTNSSCGLSAGAIELLTSGGTVALDYVYSIFTLPGMIIVSATNTAAGLDGGLYGYTVTDDNGCLVEGSFTISDDLGLLEAIITDESCEGTADGAVNITVTGLTGDITFLWSGPNGYSASTEDISGLEPGTYTVSITDDNGCVLGDSYEVLPAAGIMITAVVTDVSCNGLDNGAIDIVFSGGMPDYAFLWSGPNGFFSFNEDISGLEPGSYTITITDGDDCVGNATFTIDEPDLITVSPIISGVLCNGDNSGSIAITVNGGNGGNLYSWTGPDGFTSSFEDITDLFAGTYTLTITDSNGCTFNASYDVLQSPAITITLIEIIDANCNLNNGSIEVIASNGNPDYSYDWTDSGGSTVDQGPLAEDLATGVYMVTVTDDDDCEVSASYTVSNSEAFLSAVIDSVSCNGFSDGAIDLSIAGTLVGTVDTVWTGPDGFMASSEDLNGLAAGDYTITLTDDVGCVFTETYTVSEPLSLASNAVITPVSCNGDNDGAIDLTTSGGTGSVSVSWTGPGTFMSNNTDISGLFAGTYEATLLDANLCTALFTYEVTEPSAITATAIVVNVLCNGEATGAIDLSPSGGGGQNTFAWTGPDFTAMTEDISGLFAGTYEVTVTDANMCDEVFSFEVLQNEAIVISLENVSSATCGLSNGSAEVSAAGGDNNLFYQWTDEDGIIRSNDALATDLEAGTYTVTVTDGNDCSVEMEYDVVNQDVGLIATVTDVSCFGLNDGAIDLTVSGSLVGIVDTLWAGDGGFMASSEDLENLLAGEYSITISDEVGCVLTDDFTVSEPELLETDGTITPNLCNGDTLASIDTETNGGTLDYSYSWTGPDGFTSLDPDISDLGEGTYILTVTDDHDCVSIYSGLVTDPDTLIATSSVVDPTCLGLENGSIDLTPMGGTGDPSFDWLGPDGFMDNTEDILTLGPGTYTLTMTDENLCVFTDSYMLNSLQVMDIELSTENLTCNGSSDGSIELEVEGGSPDYGYVWDGPDPFTSIDEDINGLEAGEYVLQITDDAGCTLDTLVALMEPDVLEAIDVLSEDLDCFEDSSGAISLDIIGGTPDYSWNWTGPNDFTASTEDITELQAGEYSLNASDDNGCPFSLTINLSEPSLLNVSALNITGAVCENSPDGMIDVVIVGGTPDYNPAWTGPEGFSADTEDLSGLLPGDYTITVTDDNDCVTTEPFVVGFQIEINADAGIYDPICNGEQLTLDGSGSEGAASYAWSLFGGNTFSNDINTTLQASTESDIVILTISNGLCVDRDTVALDILLLPQPDAGMDITTFQNEEVILGGNPTWDDAASFSWFPSGVLDDPSSPNPIYINQASTTFTVTVIGNNGCIASDMITVTLDPTIEVPDGFTPNEDTVNDTWELANVGLFPKMRVQVFSRWGDELFESPEGYPEPWDGTYGGSPLPVGTYYYVIELNDPLFPEAITGPLTIFR